MGACVQVNLLPNRDLIKDGKLAPQTPRTPFRMGDAHNMHGGTSGSAISADAIMMPGQRPADRSASGLPRILPTYHVVDHEARRGER